MSSKKGKKNNSNKNSSNSSMSKKIEPKNKIDNLNEEVKIQSKEEIKEENKVKSKEEIKIGLKDKSEVENKIESNVKLKEKTKTEFKDKPKEEIKIKAKTKSKAKEDETKEEQVVFKNDKKKKSEPKNNVPKEKLSQNEINKKINKDASSQKVVVSKKTSSENGKKVNNINTPEFFEENSQKKRKIIFILINVITILIVLLIFSTIFALIHKINPTVAKGVSIKNIDISNLTYNEAKDKLEEAFNVVLDVNIELKYEDYSDIVRASDINLAYNINNALDEAYNIGRSGNIVECNYSLIATAFLKKNIDFDFTYDEDEIDKIVNQVSTEIPGIVKQYSYYIEEDNLIINPGTDGIKVKTEELKNLILEEIQNRNPLELVKSFKNTQIEIPYEEVKADKIDIDQIYSEVYSEPQDAYYTEATEDTKFAIYSDVDGIDFAISIDEAKQIVSEEGKTEYIIPLNKSKASISINDIGIEAFPYEISQFPTNYDASNLSRSENLRIAASKINGTVIMPGEQFSFNEVVGERTVAEGYQDAKIYSDGQVVDGLAGGICQISSTLYNAALLANLQIDERYNHTFTTSYVKAGRDATVVYGVKDLKFTNNREYPIKIEVSVSNGVVLFKIYGIQEENEYDVKIIPETIDVTPFTVQTITDYSLTPGTSVIKQNGSSGCKVITYKEVWLNGSMISREVLSNDTYKVLNKIVAVGPTQTSSEE